jgi:hypothetical protein
LFKVKTNRNHPGLSSLYKAPDDIWTPASDNFALNFFSASHPASSFEAVER